MYGLSPNFEAFNSLNNGIFWMLFQQPDFWNSDSDSPTKKIKKKHDLTPELEQNFVSIFEVMSEACYSEVSSKLMGISVGTSEI